MSDVIIIGAGTAGPAAAKTLKEERPSTSIKVLEADDRTGGRALTGTVGGNAVELGCQWIHGSQANPLTPQISKLGFEAVEMGPDALFVGNRRATPHEEAQFKAVTEEFEGNLAALAEAGRDVSAKEALPSGKPFAGMVETFYGPLEASVELDRASAVDVHGFNAGDDDVMVKGGLGTLVQEYGKDVDVQLSTPVKEVKYRRGIYHVTTEENGREVVHKARRLIITVSNGVLAAGGIKFDPPLPRKVRKAIAGLPMGDMNKLIFAFDTNVFGDTEKNVWVNHAASENSAASDNFGLLVRPEGQNVAVVFVGGEVAQTLEEQGEEAARTLGLEKLKEIYGEHVADHVVDSHVTEWGKNPFSRGCYTAALPGEAHQRMALQEPFRGARIAGEAATSPELSGSVGGAYQSGVEAARQMATSLDQKDARFKNLILDLTYAIRHAARSVKRAA